MNLDDKLLGHEKKKAYLSTPEEVLTGFLGCLQFVMPNLNDTFAYACADTEQISVGEEEIMGKWLCKHGWYGLVAIAAVIRDTEPIREVLENEDYKAAIADLDSDEIICCEGEKEGGSWRWWLDLPGGIAPTDEDERGLK